MKILPTLAVLATTVGLSQAALFDFTTILTGDQEVPANSSPGTGSGTATYDSDSMLLTVSGTFTGLEAAANNAHVHLGALGIAGGVVFGIDFTAATSGTYSGSGTLSEANEIALFNEGLYINIHSSTYPGGEIRGQLVPVPEPETYAAVAGLGLVGFGLWRRRSTRA